MLLHAVLTGLWLSASATCVPRLAGEARALCRERGGASRTEASPSAERGLNRRTTEGVRCVALAMETMRMCGWWVEARPGIGYADAGTHGLLGPVALGPTCPRLSGLEPTPLLYAPTEDYLRLWIVVQTLGHIVAAPLQEGGPGLERCAAQLKPRFSIQSSRYHIDHRHPSSCVPVICYKWVVHYSQA